MGNGAADFLSIMSRPAYYWCGAPLSGRLDECNTCEPCFRFPQISVSDFCFFSPAILYSASIMCPTHKLAFKLFPSPTNSLPPLTPHVAASQSPSPSPTQSNPCTIVKPPLSSFPSFPPFPLFCLFPGLF